MSCVASPSSSVANAHGYAEILRVLAAPAHLTEPADGAGATDDDESGPPKRRRIHVQVQQQQSAAAAAAADAAAAEHSSTVARMNRLIQEATSTSTSASASTSASSSFAPLRVALLRSVKRMLADHRHVDASTRHQFAIRTAARHGYVELVKLLLRDARVDPSVRSNEAIRVAARNGHACVVELLLADARVDPSVRLDVALRHACLGSHLRVVRVLVADARVDANVGFDASVSHGRTNVVALLLRVARVDPARNNQAALITAASEGYMRTVEHLLRDTRVDPSTRSQYAVRTAAGNGKWRMVERLLRDARVDPSACDNEALRGACAVGAPRTVDVLLRDARVTFVVTGRDRCVFTLAVRKGRVAVVARLLLHLRDVDPPPSPPPPPHHCIVTIAIVQLRRYRGRASMHRRGRVLLLLLRDDARVDVSRVTNHTLVMCVGVCLAHLSASLAVATPTEAAAAATYVRVAEHVLSDPRFDVASCRSMLQSMHAEAPFPPSVLTILASRLPATPIPPLERAIASRLGVIQRALAFLVQSRRVCRDVATTHIAPLFVA